jgi:hypothetical protein
VAELILFIAVLAVPILLGAATAYLSRPWRWGAVLAIAVVFVAAIAPEPEEGESRLVAGDLVFLLVVALVVMGLTWLGAWAARRLRGARA